MNVLLFGTGAVGSYYAGKLAQAGAYISAVCRSDYEIVKESGIHIKSISGDFHFSPARVLQKAAEYTDKADFIIVSTKVLPEINIPELIKDAVSENTSIVLLQNGIEIEKNIADAFPQNEIISALAFICVSRPEYGFIDHQDQGRIILGTYPSGITGKVRLLSDTFIKSGVKAEIEEDIIFARWKKLLWNAPFNPLSVIGCADTKTLLDDPEMTSLIKEVMQEVIELSRADGHPLSSDLADRVINDTKKMKPYKTSMLLDYENNRPLEVTAILGNAIKIGERYSLHIPALRIIFQILSFLNKQNLKVKP